MKTLEYAVKIVNAMITGAAATTTGTGFDRSNYGECLLVVSTGAATGTPDSFTVNSKLQESDVVGSGYTDISGGAITAITAAATTAKKRVSLYNKKQFIRVVTVHAFVGGTSPAVPTSVTVLLGDQQSGPSA